MDRLTVAAFRSGGVGWCAGDGYLLWRADARLVGLVWWGDLSENTIDESARVLQSNTLAQGGRMELVTDSRRVTAVQRAAVTKVMEFLRDENAFVVKHLERQVAIIASRPEHATLIGVVPMSGFPWPMTLVTDDQGAVAALSP